MKTIYIGNVEVPVRATGFTTVLFKRFTGNDLLSTLADNTRAEEKINDVLSLFFCINVQATTEKIGEMFNIVDDINNYYEFLNKFDSKDLYDPKTIGLIMGVWVKAAESKSDAKNG